MRLKTGRWGAVALGLSGVLLGAGAARADDAALRKVIESNYARYVEGMKHVDIGPGIRMEAPDYSHVAEDGTVMWRWRCDYNDRAIMKSIEEVPEESVHIDQFKVSHHRVDVEITERTVFLMRDPRTKALHRLNIAGIEWDVWILTKAGWKLQRQTDLAHRETLDGVAVGQPAPPSPASKPPTPAPRPAPPALPPVITPGNPAIQGEPTGSIDHVG